MAQIVVNTSILEYFAFAAAIIIAQRIDFLLATPCWTFPTAVVNVV